MALYFITGNKGKLAEVQEIISTVEQLDIDLPEIQDIDAQVIILSKLEEAQKHQQGQFIVEDTSLYLDCLNGLPGPLIKWFMKTIGNDGLYKIAQGFGNFKATAKTIIGLAKEDGSIEFFEGAIEGELVEPRGNKGFGWDPIFQPIGHAKTFAEMDQSEKNEMSMRRMALNNLKAVL